MFYNLNHHKIKKGHYHMHSLTRSNEYLNLQLQSTLEYSLSLLQAPFVSQISHLDYGMLFTNLNEWSRSFTLEKLAQALEKADLEFRNSPQRIQRYYVKQTRPRTIITILGELTFTRTEYVDRATSKPFIPIDRKLCLSPRQRYDCCVEAKAKELYADHNSMIKVGRILGDMIYSHFSLRTYRKFFNIPRQTVFNLLHRVKKISSLPPVSSETPETLYIMADEKFIPLQDKQKDKEEYNKSKRKQMVKMAVSFDGRLHLYNKDDTPSKRYALVNKYHYALCAENRDNFWENFMENLSHRYDLSKIKKIYILGDGAPWIKGATTKLYYYGVSVTFALDRYHASQAVNRMTSDDLYRKVLTYYLYQDDLEDFDCMADIIRKELEENGKSLDRFNQNLDYLHNNWKAFQVMVKEVKIGCAMEQAISHVLASPFTSVPKAYGKNNLPIYLDSRIHLQNRDDLLRMHLLALDQKENNENEIKIREDLDWSFFDDQISDTTYKINLKNRKNKKNEYPF